MSHETRAQILVVEDDDNVARAVRNVLTADGKRPTIVASTVAAIDALTSSEFDVVLLDLNLPDGNGLDLLPAIRRLQRRARTLVMTGNGDLHAARVAIERGAIGYLLKPFALNELRIQIALAQANTTAPSSRRIDSAHAVPLQQLDLLYQPQVDLESGDVVGAEALLRWRHPSRGEIAPHEFLPEAEQSREIIAIGQWVRQRACRDYVEHSRRHGRPTPPCISVNVSPAELDRPELLSEVGATLHHFGLPPYALCLEITESASIDHNVTVDAVLDGLSEMGVRLAVDDLGAGYASLARLAEHAWYQLKIDRSLTQNLGHRQTDTIIRSIIELGDQLDMEVLAEGVETEDQALRLRDLGCTLVQGFLTGRPTPISQMPSCVVPLTGRVRSK